MRRATTPPRIAGHLSRYSSPVNGVAHLLIVGVQTRSLKRRKTSRTPD